MLTIPRGTIRPGHYKAIFFDAGNTLFKVQPSVGTVYARTAKLFGFKLGPGEQTALERYFQEEWKQRSSRGRFDLGGTLKEERQWWYDLVKAVFDRLGGMDHFDPFFDHLYELFASAEVWQLFPETCHVLETCRERGLVVGIVSNWDSRLLKICEGLGLSGKVDFIIASAMVGISKPDPAIFHMALERAGVKPDEAIHLGDSLEDDIYGAYAAGMDALLIERSQDRRQQDVAMADSLHAVLDFC